MLQALYDVQQQADLWMYPDTWDNPHFPSNRSAVWDRAKAMQIKEVILCSNIPLRLANSGRVGNPACWLQCDFSSDELPSPCYRKYKRISFALLPIASRCVASWKKKFINTCKRLFINHSITLTGHHELSPWREAQSPIFHFANRIRRYDPFYLQSTSV
jgi:hypothetical protein